MRKGQMRLLHQFLVHLWQVAGLVLMLRFLVLMDGKVVLHLYQLFHAFKICIPSNNYTKDTTCSGGYFTGVQNLSLLNYGAHAIAGLHTPGNFTSELQTSFSEPRLLILTDP